MVRFIIIIIYLLHPRIHQEVYKMEEVILKCIWVSSKEEMYISFRKIVLNEQYVTQ